MTTGCIIKYTAIAQVTVCCIYTHLRQQVCVYVALFWLCVNVFTVPHICLCIMYMYITTVDETLVYSCYVIDVSNSQLLDTLYIGNILHGSECMYSETSCLFSFHFCRHVLLSLQMLAVKLVFLYARLVIAKCSGICLRCKCPMSWRC